MGRRIVAIHQPTFLPWLGFFDKLARCDLFIVLDNVQFAKKGATWSNRVRLIVSGRPAWVTVPVVRAYHGTRSIGEMLIDDSGPWRTKLLKTIQASYGKAPFHGELTGFLHELLEYPTDNLAKFNTHTIERIAGLIGLHLPRLVMGSTLGVEGTKTDLLVAMLKAVGATCYLSGDGAGGYLEPEKITEQGIGLEYQGFTHPVYPQCNTGEFVPGLSIVDALFNIGPRQTKELLQPRRQPW